MRVLILGANGQLGTELVRANPGHTLITHTRFDQDITEVQGLARFVRDAHPDWVLNTVAWNRTEDSEREPGVAFAVNTLAPGALAGACAEANARLVHFSTDFVFDGRKGAPYVESDAPSPINIYGLSKYGGERLVLSRAETSLVVRTAGLYGEAGSRSKGGHFVETILNLAARGEPVRVVSDIRVSPTNAKDLAEKVWELVDLKVPGGIYHLANAGGCAWFEFARAILDGAGAKAELQPIPAAQWPGAMRRSPDTRLASERLAGLGLKPLRPWTEALADYLRSRPKG